MRRRRHVTRVHDLALPDRLECARDACRRCERGCRESTRAGVTRPARCVPGPRSRRPRSYYTVSPYHCTCASGCCLLLLKRRYADSHARNQRLRFACVAPALRRGPGGAWRCRSTQPPFALAPPRHRGGRLVALWLLAPRFRPKSCNVRRPRRSWARQLQRSRSRPPAAVRFASAAASVAAAHAQATKCRTRLPAHMRRR